MQDEKGSLSRLEVTDLMNLLPHRYPFLMIDRIVEIDGDDSAIGIKNVSYNEPMFTGHFPGKPVFPGVLILEGMAQTAGAIVINHQKGSGANALVYLLTIDKAKFRKPAVPGDQLQYHIKKLQLRRNMGRYAAKAMAGDDVIAEAEIGAMIVPEEQAPA